MHRTLATARGRSLQQRPRWKARRWSSTWGRRIHPRTACCASCWRWMVRSSRRRFPTSYTRIGGVSRDTPKGWVAAVRKFCDEVVVNFDESETLLTRNRIFVDRTKDVGIISREDAIDYGLTGPNLRGCGVDYDVRKAHPYLVYKDLEFDVPIGSV